MNGIIKVLQIIGCLLLFINDSQSQYHELGLQLGIGNYLGDLVPPKEYFWGTNPAIGLSYQYNVRPRIVIRGQVLWAHVSGDDRNASYGSSRK